MNGASEDGVFEAVVKCTVASNPREPSAGTLI